MRGNLYKRGSEYRLYVGGIPYATTDNGPYKKLSKQNCDEIFGVVDVEKLACDECRIDIYAYKFIQNLKTGKTKSEMLLEAKVDGFIKGFNKAWIMNLNKDKVFTTEDMKEAILFGLGAMYGYKEGREGETEYQINKFVQSLQQPTEIEVEIVMGDPIGITDNYTPDTFPKLDKKNQLILKKI